VLASAEESKAERIAAQKAFLKKRAAIWKDIQEGGFPPPTRQPTNAHLLEHRAGRQFDVIFCWRARLRLAQSTRRTAYPTWLSANCFSTFCAIERCSRTERGRSSTAAPSARPSYTSA